MALEQDVLDFWFGAEGSTEFGQFREVWFQSTSEFDAEIDKRFGQAYEDAAAGRLDRLKSTGEGCLALIILLDQFPRNLFRGTAKAFATDTLALDISADAIAKGFDSGMNTFFRMFLYMPHQHSEDLQMQARGVELFTALNHEESSKSSKEHHEVIEKFGRFPHRNAILGRDSTPAEQDYLKDASGWGQKAPDDGDAA